MSIGDATTAHAQRSISFRTVDDGISAGMDMRKEYTAMRSGSKEAGWTGEGTVSLANGSQFGWKVKSMWKGIYIVTDLKQNVLLETTMGLGAERSGFKDWFKTQSRVRVSPDGHAPATISLLALISWYFLLNYREVQRGAVVATG
jgi:hypothetical protein